MVNIAEVIPATRIARGQSQVFTYAVPDGLVSGLAAGQVVEIPFGGRRVSGVVLAKKRVPRPAFPLKTISKILWQEPIFTEELLELAKFISENYLVSLGLVVKMMIARPAPRARDLDQLPPVARASEEISLNKDQQAAVETVLSQANRSFPALLHGVTGSGKTEVYIRIIQKLLKRDKQALILIPEIALTPQTLSRFAQRFDPKLIAVVHSRVSYGQKFLVWKKIFNGEVKILIGPRSALFAPFKNLGLIVIDEEHDSSFKQFDQNPKYHTREVAKKLSAVWSCPLILGDATPSVETYYQALAGNLKLLELKKRIKQEMPKVEAVDMREESRGGNFSIFSERLIGQIKVALSRNQQIILFINRRGAATALFCRDCGNLAFCRRCEVPLVYHRDIQKLVCHHCERRFEMFLQCGRCGGYRLKLSGTGTQKVEYEIKKMFPKIRVKRLDRDTVTKRKEFETLYRDFIEGRFDLLIGTQLLAKGWDLSRVGLIGIINADTILQLPDFRSNERTFQLITQVAGRAGRGDFPGRVVLQTYNPENFALRAAVNHDYQSFFKKEILDRKEFFYPPFSRLIKLTIKHSQLEKALEKAESVAAGLQKVPGLSSGSVLGPAPAFIPKVRGRFVVYVIIKVPVDNLVLDIPRPLKDFLNSLGPEWDIDVDPDTLL